MSELYLEHHGIKGQKWGVRRFQNTSGGLTPEGKARLKKTAKNVAKAALFIGALAGATYLGVNYTKTGAAAASFIKSVATKPITKATVGNTMYKHLLSSDKSKYNNIAEKVQTTYEYANKYTAKAAGAARKYKKALANDPKQLSDKTRVLAMEAKKNARNAAKYTLQNKKAVSEYKRQAAYMAKKYADTNVKKVKLAGNGSGAEFIHKMLPYYAFH